jgi:hypothetical protein
MNEFGFAMPVLIDEGNTIVAGEACCCRKAAWHEQSASDRCQQLERGEDEASEDGGGEAVYRPEPGNNRNQNP